MVVNGVYVTTSRVVGASISWSIMIYPYVQKGEPVSLLRSLIITLIDKGVLIVENGDWSNKNASNKNVSITGY